MRGGNVNQNYTRVIREALQETDDLPTMTTSDHSQARDKTEDRDEGMELEVTGEGDFYTSDDFEKTLNVCSKTSNKEKSD